ncbi:MAG: cation:proton antiporter [Candidatus Onthomorpha sp.]|nr:cation:proton antiporter [Bacteroidales bacterium]MCI6800520.1 cation:proton antiporter [Bacteroidales bacterium]MCI6962277.1 cation:proton antiporter [Bacteroidales bacterium]MDD7539892.1 cation:proton antiporter [Bacteroidales bacterium]MDY4861064.1 cation:proton antiporter [Candidatus Onthomorpha sp.]
MTHLPTIITDLSLILILASIFSVLCKILKQPVVLGYIVAGLLAGPHISLIPTVQPENISTWADIGVIFLLFGMGLEFSFKKMMSIGKVGGKAMLFEVLTLSVFGFAIGRLMGWNFIDSMLLGGMLTMSSTAIIVKAFNDMGLQKEKFAGIVFGILVFEDLFAILLMVILSTFAVSRSFEGSELAMMVARLGFFLVMWFVCGIYLIPTLLKKIKKYLNSETLLLVAMGLCFLMVVLATKAGFSSALGAFIMGSILAETIELENIEKVIQPIKDFFGAIFFVSVGMMVDPQVLFDNFSTVIIIAAASIAGKMIFTTTGVRLAGESMKTAVQSGFSLAQMGEFSFIIASMGMSLGVTSASIYPIVIAVSVITTFTTPYTIKLALPAYHVLESVLPNSLTDKLNKREDKKAGEKESQWKQLLMSYFFNLAIFSAICLSVYFVSAAFLLPLCATFDNLDFGHIIFSFVSIIAMSPFLIGMVRNRGRQSFLFLSLWSSHNNNRYFLTAMIGLRWVVAIVFLFMTIKLYWNISSVVIVVVALVVFAFIFQNKNLQKGYWKLEARFVKNFNQRQIEMRLNQNSKQEGNMHELDNLHWIDKNLYVSTYLVQKGGVVENKTLKELNLRKVYDIIIVAVTRNGKQINFPDGDFRLEVNDTLLALGQIQKLKNAQIDYKGIDLDYSKVINLHDFTLKQQADKHSSIKCMTFIIGENSSWIDKNLYDAQLNRKTNCLVVGIERGDIPIPNPSSHVRFKKDDMVWVMGDDKSLYKLLETNFFE